MFGRKIKCRRCSRKVEKEFDFCPYCGNSVKESSKEDYGILGKNDDLSEMDEVFKHSFGFPGINSGIGNSLFNKMFSGAFKMLNNEVRKMAEESMKMQKKSVNENTPDLHTNFELFINGKKVNLPGNIAGIQIEGMPGAPLHPHPQKIPASPRASQKMPKVSEETLKAAAKLPRKEAKSKVSRTSNSVIYELEAPGISSLNNVLINKLESNLEIKVFTEKAVFIKTLPAKLPLMKYSINPQEGKLILEFKA